MSRLDADLVGNKEIIPGHLWSFSPIAYLVAYEQRNIQGHKMHPAESIARQEPWEKGSNPPSMRFVYQTFQQFQQKGLGHF